MKKTNGHALLKLKWRQRISEMVGHDALVLELYAGESVQWAGAWHEHRGICCDRHAPFVEHAMKTRRLWLCYQANSIAAVRGGWPGLDPDVVDIDCFGFPENSIDAILEGWDARRLARPMVWVATVGSLFNNRMVRQRSKYGGEARKTLSDERFFDLFVGRMEGVCVQRALFERTRGFCCIVLLTGEELPAKWAENWSTWEALRDEACHR